MTTMDETILSIFQKLLLDDVQTITRNLNQQRKKHLDGAENELKNYRRRLGETEKSMKNVTNAVAKGLNQPEMFEKLSELSNTRDSLNDQIKATEALTELNPVTEEEVKEAIRRIQVLPSTENNREAQLALESMIVRFTINDDRIEATFKVAS